MLCLQVRVKESVIFKNSSGDVYKVELCQVKENYKCKFQVTCMTNEAYSMTIYNAPVRQPTESEAESIKRVGVDVDLGGESVKLINNGKPKRLKFGGNSIMLGVVASKEIKIAREKIFNNPSFDWEREKKSRR